MDKYTCHTNSVSEVLDELLTHMNWCLSNYENINACDLDRSDHSQLEATRPDWTFIRSLQNNLYGFLDRQEDSQAIAVASLLIHVIDKTFSDLCAATPWDNNGVIDVARINAHKALINLLIVFKDAIKSQHETDGKLWEGYKKFEASYNKILFEVNEKDQAIIGQ